MQRMRSWWSALSRRILLYFCTLLIPILIMFLLFYRQAFTASLEDLSEKIVLNMGTTVERVDISITTMQKASMMLLNDMRVRKYVKPISECTAEDRIQQIDVFSTIGALANIGASNLVETMFLYLDDQHVFSDGLYAFDQYFTRLFQFEAYGPEFWTDLLAEKNSHWGMLPATTLKISPTNTSRRVVPSYVSSTVTGRRMLVVTVYSVPKLLEVLRSDAILPEMRSVIVGEDGSPVLSMLAENQTSEALAAIAQAGGADVFKTSLDGVAYRVLRQKSQVSGWSFFVFVPMRAFSANARSLLILQGLSLGMLGLGLLLSIYYTYRICRPIRRIRTTLESGYRNTESDGSLDDVAVIHQKLNSLLLDYEEAREERLSITEEFLQSGMLQLLSGHTEHRLPRMLALLRRSYRFAGASYRCALLHVHLAEGIEKTLQDTQRLNLLSNMRADLSALIGQHIPCYVLEHRESQYLCVLCDEDLSGARVRAIFEELLERMRESLPLVTLRVILGVVVPQITEIDRSFLSAAETLAQDAQDASSIRESALPPRTDTMLYALRDEVALTQALRDGDKERTHALLSEILRKNRENAPPGAFPLLIHELYVTGMRYLASRNQVLPDAERYRTLLKSDPLWNDKQVELLHAFLDEVVAQTDTQPTPMQPNLSDTIAAYVQAHYAQDLYLERIAQDMGLSVKYLSKVFKDKTGENLSDYINRVRMEHVRDMLKNTDMSINDISQAVGIFSRSTFTRVFRKLEGVTPSEYRELVREQGNVEEA